jgi:hypothetical protein
MDGHWLLIRGSWADEAGLVKPAGEPGYTDEFEQPGELPYCRCSYVYLYTLRALPPGMITAEGARRMAKARELTAA